MMKYGTYKDSGIEWLGDIPAGWTLNRLKNLGYATIGITYSPENVCNEDEGILVLRSSNIQDDKFSFKDNVYVDFKPRSKYLTRLNDILICSRNGSRRLIGKNVRVDEENVGKTFGAFMTIYRSSMNDFISYFFKSQLFDYQSGAFMTSTINQLTIGTLNLLHLPVPPFSEQKAIAQYLDTKTQAIDKKVGLLQQKIDYYTELRKSIINDAVTKGLDKDVKLKGSEIGLDIPKHWLRHRLKDIGNLYSGLSGKSGDDFRQDDHEHNKGYIPFTNIAANTYIADDNLGTVVVEPTESQNQVRKGDVFFLMSSEGYEDIGKSSVLDKDLGETYLNSFCKGYRLKSDKHNPIFINYLLLSDSYRQLLIVEGKGFTRINLKMEKVNNFFIHIPPTKAEQTEIAQYLDNKTNTIDAIITNIGKQLDHLKELRKTLINDVVTGKIKVVPTN